MRLLTVEELAAADPADFLPIREVARLLLVHPATVRKWVHDGRLGYAVVEGRQHVLLPDASRVEQAVRHAPKGRPRRMTRV